MKSLRVREGARKREGRRRERKSEKKNLSFLTSSVTYCLQRLTEEFFLLKVAVVVSFLLCKAFEKIKRKLFI